jgi:hypothetical protein
MDGVGPGGCEDAGADPPPTVEALADLQAGLLDDDTAARLRKKVRDDPDARQAMDALTRVRGDIAALGNDATSAAEVAPEVADRIATTLRNDRLDRFPHPAHSIRPGRLPRTARVTAGIAGLVAAATAAGVGTAALMQAPAPTSSRPITGEQITVSGPPMTIPLTDPQIRALVGDKPDFGPLADPRRRTSCLAGLGYPADARVLGATPVQLAGRPAIVLVLPADAPGAVTAVAVPPTCSSADTGLLADRLVERP